LEDEEKGPKNGTLKYNIAINVVLLVQEDMGMCLSCMKYDRSERKIPLDFTNDCVKWLGQKGTKLQAALPVGALNGKGGAVLRSQDTERGNERRGKTGKFSPEEKGNGRRSALVSRTGPERACAVPEADLLVSQTEEDRG